MFPDAGAPGNRFRRASSAFGGAVQQEAEQRGAAVLAVLVVVASEGGLRTGFGLAAALCLGGAAAGMVLLRDPHLHLKADVGAGSGAG
jgi:hypothetical protein